jgi:LysR family glycine cleavage system transcriptional activator
MIPRSLPPLSTLKVFESAARLRSFKGAAEELSLTQSAISHQIASLERYLGTALFCRLPGRVELNEKGELYFPVIQDALDRISLTTDLIREKQTQTSLTVQVYVTVAVRWLIPRLQTFKDASPEIAVSLDASLLDWEFNPARADVGIIYTRTPDRPNLTYTLLKQERLVAVCSKKLAKAIAAPEDLRQVPFLAISGTTDDSLMWARSIGLPSLVQSKSPRFDSSLLAIEAAINGQGVVVVPEFLVEADLQSGNLVIPIQTEVMQAGGWYLAHVQRRGHELPIQRFLEWIQAQ